MAALTCMYSAPSSPAISPWQEAATQQQDKESAALMVIAAYDLPKRKTSSQIVSMRRNAEEGGGAEGEGEVYWEGMARREIAAGVEDVWEMLGTFSAMKKWNAAAEVCEIVEGRDGEVGCVRYCAGGGRWVKEKLLEMEPEERRFKYSLIDSSYGFQGYVATLAVQPVSSSHGDCTGDRTLAHWNFQLEPVPHLGQEKLLDFLTALFDRMMSSLEQAIATATSSDASSAGPSLPQAASNDASSAEAAPLCQQTVAVAN